MLTEEELIERVCQLEAVIETAETVLCAAMFLGFSVGDQASNCNYLPHAHKLCHDYLKKYETLETPSKRNERLKEVKLK